MPHLLPRTDQVGWVTPAINQVIEAVSSPNQSDEDKQQLLSLFRGRLAQLGINAEVMDVHFTPSHLRYYLRPAGESIAPNQYEQFITQIRQSLTDIKRVMTATTAEVMISPAKPLVVQLLLRPASYSNFELGHILRRRDFIETPSTTLIPLGMDTDERPVMQDLANLRHLLVIGESTTRFNFLASMLTTLSMFNTPIELRYALIGQDTDPFAQLAQTPHVLGGTLTSIRELLRLLDGLVKHLGQRKQQFSKFNATDIETYNAGLSNTSQQPFPRLLIVIDTIPFEEEWIKERESWFSGLYRLVKEGPSVGIYVVITAKSVDAEIIPPQLLGLFKTQLVMRSALQRANWRKPLPSMPMPFIDAVFQDAKNDPIGIELPQVDDKILANLVKYWRQMTAKRSMAALAQGKQKTTGDTGLLTLRQDARLKIARATAGANAATPAKPIAAPDVEVAPPMPESSTQSAPTPQPALQPALQPAPKKATATLPPLESFGSVRYRQASALAAYLGWLSLGPLVDVLDMTIEEARNTIEALQKLGVIESNAGPIYRFLRIDKK